MRQNQNGYSALRHICWSIFLNRDPENIWLLMVKEFAAYFDDSGHPNQQMAVVVAGFIASEKQWLAFEKKWRKELSLAGISIFHMTDLEAGQGEFKGWARSKRRAFLDRMARIILDYTRKHFATSVLIDDYKRVNSIYTLEQTVGTPYAIAGRTIAKDLNEWKATRPEARVRVIFENGTKHKGDFMDAMERDELPVPIFEKKSEVIQLQAADFLAWEVFYSTKTGKIRPTLQRIINAQGDTWDGYYGKEALERMCKSPGSHVLLESELTPGAVIAHHSSLRKPRRKTLV